jgi:hypothetical protein
VLASTVSDHSFRVLPDDPLYTDYNWDINNYSDPPAKPYPTDVASKKWIKRQAVKLALLNNLPVEYEAPVHCDEHMVMVESDRDIWCIPDDREFRGGERYTLPVVTYEAILHPSPTTMVHTKAKAEAGPIETASKEGADAVRKYLYGI